MSTVSPRLSRMQKGCHASELFNTRPQKRPNEAMPRYFFHIKDKAKTTLATQGVDLDSLDEVREEATESARQLTV
jgi:Domain of unknown function (DUF6894)